MLHLISLFALLLPQAQAPSAADLMPADTFLYLEASLEPFDRLGEHTVATQLYKKSEVSEVLAPFQGELQSQLDEISLQLGFDLGSLIGSSRFSVAFTWELLRMEGGYIPFAVELSSEVAKGVDLAAILNEVGIGVWAQSGDILVGVLHTEELDQMESGQFGNRDAEPSAKIQKLHEGGVAYLHAMMSREAQSGMTGLKSWQAMSASCRTNNDLFGGWLMLDKLNRELIEEIIGEPTPDELLEAGELFELDKFRGFGWAMNVAPPMLEDRIMVYGPGMMRKYFPAEVNEASNLPALMSLLPHDSWQTMMMAADFAEVGNSLRQGVEIMLGMTGETVPEEAENFMNVAFALLSEAGPVFCSNTRMEDFSRGLPGDLWLQARHPEKVQEALSGLPEELKAALDEGMSFVPGMPSILLASRGNRLAIFESVAAPSSQTLATAPEFQSAAKLYSKFPISQIYATEFIHRDLLVDAMSTLRSEGNDLLNMMTDGADLPIDFSMLPNSAVVAAVMPSAPGVSIVNEEGFYSEGQSPFGRLATSLLVRIPSALKMMGNFGLMSTGGELNEEEF